MKKNIRLFLFAFSAALLLLSLSCNIEDDGVFYRASISQPTVDVGAVTVIDFNTAGNVIAYTKDEGMQEYIVSSETWQAIDLADILSSLLATDADGDIYVGARSAEGETANTLYSIAKADNSVATYSSAAYDVVSMGLYGDIMITETDTVFELRAVSAPTTVIETFPTATYSAARVLAQDDDTYLVSLFDSTDADNPVYTSKLYHGVNTITVTTPMEASVKAFFIDSSDRGIFVLSDGKIYRSADVNSDSPTDTGNSVLLDDSRTGIEFLPVITNGDALYFQGLDNVVYEIDMTDGSTSTSNAEAAINTTLSTFDIISYITNGTKHYAGTVEHGIQEIEFATP